MGMIGLITSIGLPWMVGTFFCHRIRSRTEPGAWAWRLGYGYLFGLLLATLLLRGMNAAGLTFNFMWAAATLAAIGVVIAAPWPRTVRLFGRGKRPAVGLEQPPGSEPKTGAATRPAVSGGTNSSHGERIICAVLLALLAFHAATILLELIARPLFPWDAWAQWATKAKVWTAMGKMVPFLAPAEWLTQGGHEAYTDAASHYPATVPLFQVWTALGLGRWDEALVNLPWFGLWLALVLAAYGHARAWPLRASAALAVAFGVGSLPFANIHAMLAGYADLPQAAVYTLAALASITWARTRAAHHAVTAVLCALACPFIKQPGLIWVATLVPAFLVTWNRRLGLWLVSIGTAAALVVLGVLGRTDVAILGYQPHVDFRPVGAPLAANLLLYGNWNLLFWFFPIALAFGWRRTVSPEWLPFTLTIASGVVFLLVVFFFTSASAWVENQTTVNRAVLHLAPLMAFFTATLLAESLIQREHAASRGGPRARSAAGRRRSAS
jgi:hypothetical protein